MVAASTTFRIAALTLALLLSVSAAAEIRTFVDPKVIDETETLRLTLRLEGSRSADAPDLTPLARDFEVLGSNSSSQYRSINGQVQSWVEYQINLRPRTTGTLTIPALELAGERSDPTEVQVRALDPVLRQEIDRMVFFETEVNPAPVYVQAELVFTRRLYYSTSGGVQMYSDLPGAPELADAVVIPLAEARSFAERRGDIDYGVVEQRFAIYPESSGTITIPAVALTTSVRVLKNGRMRRSGIRVASDPVNVTVLPIPAEYPSDQPWLPATLVTVRQSVDPQTRLSTGSPLSHNVRVEVQGNVSSAIAPVAAHSGSNLQQALRAYPEAPVTSDLIRSGTNIGRRDQTTSLLPVLPGNLTLPALAVVWWDTGSQRVRTTRAEPIALRIGGIAVEGASDPEPAVPANPPAPEPEPSAAEDVSPLVTPVRPLRQWPWLVLLALAGLALLLWQYRGRWGWYQRAKTKVVDAVSEHRRHSASDIRKNLSGRLQRSAAMVPAAGAAERRTALIDAVSNLHDVNHRDATLLLAATASAAPVLAALNAQCFGNHTVRAPTDTEIKAALASVKPAAAHSTRAVLPPLYPER